jgi:hypothetical protein
MSGRSWIGEVEAVATAPRSAAGWVPKRYRVCKICKGPIVGGGRLVCRGACAVERKAALQKRRRAAKRTPGEQAALERASRSR